MTDARDPFANDPFADDLFADPLVSDPPSEADDVEWLAGTSWRAALDLPLDDVAEPLDPVEPDPIETAPWEVDG